MLSLHDDYESRFGLVLEPMARSLCEYIQRCLGDMPRIDRVTARAKGVEKFVKKASKTRDDGQPKYTDPLHQIQDQIGARVITFFKSDVERVSECLLRYLRPIETRAIIPESEWQFGYFGLHHVLLIPSDIVDKDVDSHLVPECFELQIKTLFQHAWSEAEHDIGYKPGAGPLEQDDFRQLAYTSAQAWGADRSFDELFQKLEARSQQSVEEARNPANSA